MSRARQRGPAPSGDPGGSVAAQPAVSGLHELSTFNPLSPMTIAEGFPRIGTYGFLSDCHTGALVGTDGAVDWLCIPRFDSPSVFSALLDRSAGQFRVGPYGVYAPGDRRYLPGTNVLETTRKTHSGCAGVHDALIIAPCRAAGGNHPCTRPPTDSAAH